jgi:lipid-A-disaccharide synthase
LAQSIKDTAEILIVAGEASSALYASRLLEYWKQSGARVKAFGVGSRAMEALGFEIVGRSEDMAVVGLVEVLKHYGEIRAVYKRLIELATERRPKAILLLDYPDFNLRLAKDLKKLGIPIIYYISPQVWAWRKSRIQQIRQLVDKMLVVLPFEEGFYRENGVAVEFVGHPLLDEIQPQLFENKDRAWERAKYGLQPEDFCIGLMPGSRNSELEHHLAVQIETAERMHAKYPHLKFALLVAPTFSLEQIRARMPNYSLPLIFIKDEPMRMVSLVDSVLCASGTATLVVGLMKKPMVIMYKMNALTAWLARVFVKGTEHFGLINLILGGRVVTELFQEQANPNQLADELAKFVDDKKHYIDIQNKLAESHVRLGQRGATVRVANALKEYLF